MTDQEVIDLDEVIALPDAKETVKTLETEHLRNEYMKKAYLLRIILFRDDIEGSFTPPPFYFKITRFCYLWSFMPEIKDFFDYYAQSTTKHENWFEYKGTPVPWDLPFGAVYDMLLATEKNDKNYFDVVFHYRNYPNKVLGPLKNIEYIKDSIIHNMKEAAWIRSGRNDCVKTFLNPQDVIYIWQYFKSQSIADIHSITDKLKVQYSSGKLPVKVYIRNTGQLISKSVEAKWKLKDLMQRLFPKIFDVDDELKEEYKNFAVFISGIPIPLETDLSTIDSIFIYMDQFIYLVVAY